MLKTSSKLIIGTSVFVVLSMYNQKEIVNVRIVKLEYDLTLAGTVDHSWK